MTTQIPLPPKKPLKRPLVWCIVISALVVFVTFLLITPKELLTYTGSWFLSKTNMVGYAVCHQIPSHSYIVGDQPLSLCARCTGTFIGALVGFWGQVVVLRRRRVIDFPSPRVIIVLILFMAVWAGDGLNSVLATEGLNTTITALLKVKNLYEPQHWLRLTTGALNGLSMSILVYPAFNATMWRNASLGRSVRGLRDLGILVLLEAGLVGVVQGLTQLDWPWVVYLLSFLGALGVLTLLTCVNTMLALIFTQRENQADDRCDALIMIAVGFTVSLIQIAAISAMRYGVTHSFLPMVLP
jgi:uncharacterized membrane protein